MNDERPLAENWAVLEVVTNRSRVPVAYFRAAPNDEEPPFWPGCSPPARAFADPAPAPDDALKAGERVYVDCPKVPACVFGIRGYGKIDSVWPEYITVMLPEGKWEVTNSDCAKDAYGAWNVPHAACHREGPSGPPPAGEPTFLGRHDVPTSPTGRFDFWWYVGRVCAEGDDVGWPVKQIGGESMLSFLAPGYLAALAVARALGLVEAEAEPERRFQISAKVLMGGILGTVIGVRTRSGVNVYEVATAEGQYVHSEVHESSLRPAPEPERPDPGYVVGQWYEATRTGDAFRCIDRGYSNEYRQWEYKGERFGNPKDILFSSEPYMRPHTMTIADVPDEVKLAIFDGKPVRVVDVPVDDDGMPIRQEHSADFRMRGRTVVADEVSQIDPTDCVVEAEDGALWPWNLELAKGESDA